MGCCSRNTASWPLACILPWLETFGNSLRACLKETAQREATGPAQNTTGASCLGSLLAISRSLAWPAALTRRLEIDPLRCFVGSDCATKIPSGLFNGTDMYFSYDVCGGAPDCYHHPGDPHCPYDPSGMETYAVHKGDGCECLFHGASLPMNVYTLYPAHHPGLHEILGLSDTEGL